VIGVLSSLVFVFVELLECLPARSIKETADKVKTKSAIAFIQM